MPFRSSLRAACLATLAVVTLALGWLQYRWIDQASEAQEAQTKARLQEEVRLISDALDTEIARAALIFTNPVPSSSIYEALEQRWALWNHEAPWPEVALGVSLAEATDAGWQVRSLGDPGTVDIPSLLPAATLLELPPPEPNTAVSSHVEFQIPEGFSPGRPYLLHPLPTVWESTGRPRTSWAVIHYNLPYLADTLLQRVLEKYSTAEDRLEFRFQIIPKGAAAPATITSAGQFHYRPDCLMPRGNAVTGMTVTRAAGHTHGIVTRFRSVFSTQGPAPGSWLHAVGQCQMPAASSDSGLMQLMVRRPQGTLRDVYSGFRRRNEILSGAVLVVLLAALAALVISTERARRLVRLQTVVAAGISHELRTPLASLNVAADHLKNGHVENAEHARRYGEIIEAQARRLRAVVDQALALTRLSNGVTCLRVVSLPEIIEAGLAGLAARIREAGMEIECHTAPDAPPIDADPDLVVRCVINLVENAIKYARSGGWIRVTAGRSQIGRRLVAEVIVEDRGPGIPEEEATTVFEPFYRGSSARKSRQTGSGLGLAIVRSAVAAHGGWVQLERAFPHGCRFRLFFPAVDCAAAGRTSEGEVLSDAVSSDTIGR